MLKTSLVLALCLGSAALANVHGSQRATHPRRMVQRSKRLMPRSTAVASTNVTVGRDPTSPCFPSANFTMPSSVPASTDGWWCDTSEEYAFVGFSYEITACQSSSQLQKEFKDMKETYNSRYVRLYGACDNDGFYDDIVNAAWDNGLGVHALIWFGFDGTDQWESRRDSLFSTLQSNPKAPFVTRVVQFGSEPLFDSVLSPSALTSQVTAAQKVLHPLGIQVTVSELAYGYQKSQDNAQDVLDAIDFINIHMLPYFSADASTSANAWPLLTTDSNWFISHGKGKKMYWDENGWPSTHYEGVEPNSAAAVANVANEQGYYQLLDSHCEDLKNITGGGVGWFWHIYSDDQEPGYGLYDDSGKAKFSFKPKISC